MKAFNRVMTWVSMAVMLQAVLAMKVESAPDPYGQGLGVGAILGSPTGLSLKYWLTGTTAIDSDFAWHFGHEDQFQFNVDHLWHFSVDALRVSSGQIPLYVGAGLRVLAGDDSQAGVRIPLGIEFIPTGAPLEFFAEVVPVVEFAPDTDGDVDGGVGVRYYFK